MRADMVPTIEVRIVNAIGAHASTVPAAAKTLVKTPFFSNPDTSLILKKVLYILIFDFYYHLTAFKI
jgi:hypothetical protein